MLRLTALGLVKEAGPHTLCLFPVSLVLCQFFLLLLSLSSSALKPAPSRLSVCLPDCLPAKQSYVLDDALPHKSLAGFESVQASFYVIFH